MVHRQPSTDGAVEEAGRAVLKDWSDIQKGRSVACIMSEHGTRQMKPLKLTSASYKRSAALRLLPRLMVLALSLGAFLQPGRAAYDDDPKGQNFRITRSDINPGGQLSNNQGNTLYLVGALGGINFSASPYCGN